MLSVHDVMAQVDDDHGNTPANATTLILGSDAAGNIGGADDIDFFTFTLTGAADSAQDVWLYTTGNTDTAGLLFDSNSERLAVNDDSPLTDSPSNFHIGEGLAPGTYFLAVLPAGETSTGSYILKSRTGTDQGKTRSTASPATLGSTLEGVIGAAGDLDLFELDLSGESGPRQVAIYSTSSYLDAVGAILDYAGVSFDSSDDSALAVGDPDDRDFFIGQILEPGVYYVLVTSFGGGTGPYQLNVGTVPDQGGTATSAAKLSPDGSTLGFIDSRNDTDYFSLTLSDSAEVHIYTLGATDTVGELRDSSGTVLAENDDSEFSAGRLSFFLGRNLAAGTYYVKVSGFGESLGAYRVFADLVDDPGNSISSAVSLTPGTPELGIVGSANDVDLYELVVAPPTPPATATEVVLYSIGDSDTQGTLLDSGATARIATDDDSGDGLNFLIKRNLAAGTYYLRVEGTGIGEYAVSADSPATLTLDGAGVPARLSPGYDVDLFKLTLHGGADTWIYTDAFPAELLPPGLSPPPPPDTVATLYDESFNQIEFNDDALLLGRIRSSHFRRELAPGTYYVRVGSYGTFTGFYGLYGQRVVDPGSSTSTATSLTLGDAAPGTINSAVDTDYFSFSLPSSEQMFIYVRGIGRTVAAQLLDSDGNAVGRLNDRPITRGNLIQDLLAAGTYYIKVTGPGATEADPISYSVHALVDDEQNEFIDGCTELTSIVERTVGDDLYACQWHLENRDEEYSEADINVEPVWNQGVNGEGVNVAVVDDGIDQYHEDLRDNVDRTLNRDYTGRGEVYRPLEHHGTAVAGLIAARDNSIGVRGVAPRATIFGRNILVYATYANIVDSMARDLGVTAISNNSWGTVDAPSLAPIPALWERAVDAGVSRGNNGKGIFYAWAAGNGHLIGDYGNLEELANYYAVSAICAVNDRGLRSDFSERGPHLWVCGPSNDSRRPIFRGIVTTDNGDQYQDGFGGTSAASPIVAGVATLLRDANPDLTWRDLKLILAATATKADPDHPGWEEGATRYGSLPTLGMYNYNHDYGFGLVNAAAAVELARRWPAVSPLPPFQYTEISSGSLTNSVIPDNSSTGISDTLNVASGIGFTEFVEIKVDFNHDSVRDLEIELESPSGAVSLLAPSFDSDDQIPWDGTFRFGSARHLGENPNGDWQLRITDRYGGHTGTVNSWEMTVYGHAASPGPPSISAVTPVSNLLTVAWTRPIVRGTNVTAYDLRYIPTGDDESVENNWTIVEDIWTTGGGPLEYELVGLLAGASYNLQVRAVTDLGDGLWSQSFTAVPELVEGQCAEGTAVPDADENTALVSDCDILLALHAGWTGGGLLNWAVDRDISQWDGISTGGSPARVTGLEVPDRDLSGTVSASLGSLEGLRVLDLSGNGFKGAIPASIGNLTSLTALRLNDNELEAGVPVELGGLNVLTVLDLSKNSLTGSIPTELESLSDLEELRLGDNRIEGVIPDELGNLSGLTVMDLSANLLTGAIPSELATPTSLAFLDLSRNSLTGQILPELASHTGLKELNLAANELSGRIPSGFPAAVTVDFSENNLAGGIPGALGNSSVLERLDLSHNRLRGRLPPIFSQRSSLVYLDLSNNFLTGSIPVGLGSLENLTGLYIAQNSFTGCAAASVRAVENNDASELTLPYCDVLLSSLSIEGARLSPAFNPYSDTYSAVAGPSMVTVLAQAPSGSRVVLVDETNEVIGLPPQLLGGHKIELANESEEFRLRLISSDGEASHEYIIRVRRAGAPGRPVPETSVTEGPGYLTLTWTAPSDDGGFDITGYDVRYIQADAEDKNDFFWTVLPYVWKSGPLAATVNGLSGVEYDLEVRAFNGSRYGSWSTTVRGAPQSGPCAAGSAVGDPAENPGLVSDCLALLQAQDTLVGTAALNWSNDAAMSEWEGITLSGNPQRVTALELPEQELDGRIPPVLGELTELEVLDLSGNSFTGSIPGPTGQPLQSEEDGPEREFAKRTHSLGHTPPEQPD